MVDQNMTEHLPEIDDAIAVKCEQCPLRSIDAFREFEPKELGFIQSFKTGELNSDPGATIFVEGANSAHLFTVLSGWGFRYKTLEDGRRQILNYALPGDLVGLQGSLLGEMDHSFEALTPMRLCIFERARLAELYKLYPSLAYDMTWIAAREERILDEHLLSVGRRTAIERAAYLLAHLHARATVAGLNQGKKVKMPVTQQHVADTLGLSVVHTNKTLKKLSDRKLVEWLDKGCTVINSDGLAKIASWENQAISNRPFL